MAVGVAEQDAVVGRESLGLIWGVRVSHCRLRVAVPHAASVAVLERLAVMRVVAVRVAPRRGLGVGLGV